MTLAGAWQMIKTTFEASPYLAAVMALIFWLGFCWKFRLVTIGRRRSLPNMLLATFTASLEEASPATLKALHTAAVKPKPQSEPGNPAETTASSEDVRADWKLGEVYQIYWALIARGQIVRYTTVLIAFAALSLLVMRLAQPTESVSLLNVANMIGVGAFLPLAILGLLSLIMVLVSAHQIPCNAISTEKPRTIILFAW